MFYLIRPQEVQVMKKLKEANAKKITTVKGMKKALGENMRKENVQLLNKVPLFSLKIKS